LVLEAPAAEVQVKGRAMRNGTSLDRADPTLFSVPMLQSVVVAAAVARPLVLMVAPAEELVDDTEIRPEDPARSIRATTVVL
jgi:hypothetical protein